jgi:anti-sigma factor RsiW
VTCTDPDATDLGAYVLGALEPDEARRVEAHIHRCPDCAAELSEFASLPALLQQVRPEDLEPVAVAPSPDLFARTAAAAAGTGRPRSLRTRALGLVAAVVLAVLGVGAAVAVWGTGSGERSASASAGQVRAVVTASPGEDGVALDVSVAGLHPGEVCHLVAVDRDGNRHSAGEWPTSDAGDGRWVGWADIDSTALVAVSVVGDDGRELVRVPF